MRPKILVTVVATLFAVTMVAAPSFATCWICLYDDGVMQYYCQSVAGSFSSVCTPVWNQYCQLSGSAYCPEDGCGCVRYPDGNKAGKQKNTLGVMLFRSTSSLAHEQLLSSLPQLPVAVDVGSGIVTPQVALRALSQEREAAVELAAYTATTVMGPATSRLLSSDQTGFIVDARPSRDGERVRISQLVAGTLVQSANNLQLGPNETVVCRARLGAEDFACVIWARQVNPDDERPSEQHQLFTKAADAFEARNIVAFHADSPDLRLFALPRGMGVPSPWGAMAASYR